MNKRCRSLSISKKKTFDFNLSVLFLPFFLCNVLENVEEMSGDNCRGMHSGGGRGGGDSVEMSENIWWRCNGAE